MSVDETIAKEMLCVAQPAAVEAAILASEEETRKQDDVLDAWRRDLEAARYAAQRAQRQYDAADPQNRLVADERSADGIKLCSECNRSNCGSSNMSTVKGKPRHQHERNSRISQRNWRPCGIVRTALGFLIDAQ